MTEVPTIIEIGVGGTLALLILKIVFDFVAKRNGKSENGFVKSDICEARHEALRQTFNEQIKSLKTEITLTRSMLINKLEDLEKEVKNSRKK